jgi:selenocysteine-specific elongation factor
LEKSGVAGRLDPFVIRRYSPPLTIGGGVILDANAQPHKRFDQEVIQRLKSLEKEDPKEVLEGRVLAAGMTLKSMDQLAMETGLRKEAIANLIEKLKEEGKVVAFGGDVRTSVTHLRNFNELKQRIEEALQSFHKKDPLKVGLKKAELRRYLEASWDQMLFDRALEDLKGEGKIKEIDALISLETHRITLSPEQEKLRNKIQQILWDEGFLTSNEEELAQKLGAKLEEVEKILGAMLGLKEVLRMEGDIHFHPRRVEEAKTKLTNFLENNREISISQFKDLLTTTRKYALPLLLYFDGSGLTERVGDVRILRR